MSTASLTVPLCLSPGENTPFEVSPNSVEASFSAALPCSVIQWGPLLTEDVDSSKLESASLCQGVAVGCEDGTVYIFEPSPKVRNPERPSAGSPASPENQGSQPTSPRLLGIGVGNSKSRSASPSSVRSNFSPFHVTRSRIVSSVTNEQVEAPKVYVDYDEEPEKLKNLLKGKGVARDKKSFEMSPSDNSSQQDLSRISSSRRSKDDSNTSLAAPLSPGSPIRLPSSPPSPFLPPSNEFQEPRNPFCPLSMKCHVFPPSCATEKHATLKHFDRGRFFACLQQSG